MRGRIVSALLVASAMVGCRSVNPPIEGRSDPYGSPQVTFASGGLRQATAVTPPSVQRDESQLLFVTLPIRNTTSKAFTVDYRATFFDAGGGLLEETGWLSQPLEANSPATIRVNSTTPRAADFAIALRKAK